jgi:hypothetical protein
MPALWLCCAALVHCVQLQDGSEAAGGSGGAAKTWGTAVQIHDDGTAPALAVDAGGNAVAVWTQTNGFWSSRYTPSGGWSPVERISGGGDALPTAKVAMGAAGNAVAVWAQFFVNSNIFTNRYTPSGGWGLSHQIDDASGDGAAPQVAMGANGWVIAVWAQSDGARDDVWSNRYEPGSGWGTPERIETNNTLEASGAQVAVDANGNAVAVWAQSDGTRFDIWSNRYAPSSRWADARRIEANNSGDALRPQVGADADGNAVAVWQQFDGVTFDIWSSRYAGGSWGDPARIEDEDDGDASDPRVAVALDGSAVAVWQQFDGVNDDIWSNRYMPSSGWGTAVRIETNEAGSASEAGVAVDPSGIAVAVWKQFDEQGDNIWANRSTPNGGWGTAERIDTDDRGTLSFPGVAMDPSGNAVAVWRVFGGASRGIWSNRLEAKP